MRDFIKNLVRTYFDEHSREFGEGARFSEFLIVDGTAAKEDSYPADLYGYIMYAVGTAIRSSRRMRVQYYRCSADRTQRLMMNSWFTNEACFYSRIWPLCADERSRHLVAKFRTSAQLVSPTASMGALLFECDEGVHNWGYMCRLDCYHLALMAGHIGHFHGRMLETRARRPAALSKASDALTVVVRPDAAAVVPTLEQCLKLLEADSTFAQKPGHAEGVDRLRRLIAGLDSRLGGAPTVNPDCRIMCHGHYSQMCGYFGYERATPVDLRIDCWAKVGWSSLADDLVVLLFVDAHPLWRLSVRQRLVDSYREGLRSGCPHEWVPSADDIWREIRHRIPLAL